jgi:hypothetical protein
MPRVADLVLRMLDAFFVPRRTDRWGRGIDQVPTWRRVIAALAFGLTLASLVVLFIWWRNH